jgi:hypothetical protein
VTVVLLLFPAACRKEAPQARGESETPQPLPPPPASLLAEGVLRHPQATWAVLRPALARRAPTTFQLAVAEAVGIPPLSAGLVDAERPVALALVDPEPAGDGRLVAGVALTSGPEMLAALTLGASPPFTAQREPGGLALLSRKVSHDDDLTAAIVGDRLILAADREALTAAGPYVGRVLAPALGPEGEPLELTFPRSALAGPLPASLRAFVAGSEAVLLKKDEEARRLHGGRAPDFGDPRALVAVLSAYGEALAAVVQSARSIQVVARYTEGAPELRAELTPQDDGPARDLAASLPHGSAAELLTLPAWLDAAVLLRRSPGASRAGSADAAAPGPSILGDRVEAAHRALLDTWVGDVGAGLGGEVLAGVFSVEGSLGAMALGARGEGAALRRAVTTFPSVLAVPAIAEPIAAFLGKMQIERPLERRLEGGGSLVRVGLRAEGRGARAEPLPLALVSGSRGDRAAIVLAPGPAEARLGDLLGGGAAGDAAPTLAREAHVVRAVQRGGATTTAALLVRLQDGPGKPAVGALLAGTTGERLWAEVSGPGALALLRPLSPEP